MHSMFGDDSTGDISSAGGDDHAVKERCFVVLRAEAEEFKPMICFVDVDWASMQFQIEVTSQRTIPQSSSTPEKVQCDYSRRDLPEVRTLENSPNIILSGPVKIIDAGVYVIEIPRRKTMRGTCTSETLLSPTPVPSNVIVDTLPETAARCNEILDHLRKAGVIANKVQSSFQQAGSDDDQVVKEKILADYYDLLDPVGVKERHAENKTIEKRICEMEVNYLMQLLLGSPTIFSSELGGEPPGVKAQLLSIAAEVSVGCLVMSEEEFQQAYEACENCAFSWQEYFDDERLLEIRGLLRQHVRAGMLYSGSD